MHVMQAAMDFVEGRAGSDAKTSQTEESAGQVIGELKDMIARLEVGLEDNG